MKAEELRIGNYYYWISEDKEYLFEVEPKDFYNNNYKNFYPIVLTNEWLLKLGFIKDKIDNTFYKDDFDILLPNFLRYKQAQIYKIKHVHELQNLYFALTQQELTIT
jgi:hypothetical protein